MSSSSSIALETRSRSVGPSENRDLSRRGSVCRQLQWRVQTLCSTIRPSHLVLLDSVESVAFVRWSTTASSPSPPVFTCSLPLFSWLAQPCDSCPRWLLVVIIVACSKEETSWRSSVNKWYCRICFFEVRLDILLYTFIGSLPSRDWHWRIRRQSWRIHSKRYRKIGYVDFVRISLERSMIRNARTCSSSDSATRRRAACDFLQALCIFFEAQVIGIYSQYIEIMQKVKDRSESNEIEPDLHL